MSKPPPVPSPEFRRPTSQLDGPPVGLAGLVAGWLPCARCSHSHVRNGFGPKCPDGCPCWVWVDPARTIRTNDHDPLAPDCLMASAERNADATRRCPQCALGRLGHHDLGAGDCRVGLEAAVCQDFRRSCVACELQRAGEHDLHAADCRVSSYEKRDTAVSCRVCAAHVGLATPEATESHRVLRGELRLAAPQEGAGDDCALAEQVRLFDGCGDAPEVETPKSELPMPLGQAIDELRGHLEQAIGLADHAADVAPRVATAGEVPDPAALEADPSPMFGLLDHFGLTGVRELRIGDRVLYRGGPKMPPRYEIDDNTASGGNVWLVEVRDCRDTDCPVLHDDPAAGVHPVAKIAELLEAWELCRAGALCGRCPHPRSSHLDSTGATTCLDADPAGSLKGCPCRGFVPAPRTADAPQNATDGG